jgi:hypothetical protein
LAFSFNTKEYGPVVADLLAPPRVCELGPGRPNHSARGALDKLRPDALFAGPVKNKAMAAACLAGLWLYHDFLDESHALAQEIETREGAYWHGIMHRREPDYSNAKYWFHRVGSHAIFPALCAAAAEAANATHHDKPAEFLATQTAWDPFRFVDLCQAVAAGDSTSGPLCRAVQMREWELLFDYCYRRATE